MRKALFLSIVAVMAMSLMAGTALAKVAIVKADNIDTLMAKPDIDGALVGGESLKADKFLRVIHFQEVLRAG